MAGGGRAWQEEGGRDGRSEGVSDRKESAVGKRGIYVAQC